MLHVRGRGETYTGFGGGGTWGSKDELEDLGVGE